MRKHEPAPAGKRYVFRPYRRCPQTNRLLWAKHYGLKAWPILVDE